MTHDLSTWAPPYILEVLELADGHVVTDEEWNALWNTHREQGDDQSETIKKIIDNLYETAWHPTDGASELMHPALSDPDDEGDLTEGNVGDQLDTLWEKWLTLKPILAEEGAKLIPNTESVYGDNVGDQLDNIAIKLAALDGVDEHLQSQIIGIIAGQLETIPHNLLPNRDAVDAHPISAITDLQLTLDSYTTDINNMQLTLLALEHNDVAARDAASCHPVAAITYDESNTLADKLDAMDAAITLASGVSEIAHSSTTGRSAANAHPISAITGLTTELSAIEAAIALKLSKTDAASTYQPKVLRGTSAPSSSTGNNGDVYIQY